MGGLAVLSVPPHPTRQEIDHRKLYQRREGVEKADNDVDIQCRGVANLHLKSANESTARSYLWLGFPPEANLGNGEDGGDAERHPGRHVRLNNPKCDPGAANLGAAVSLQ